MLYLHTCNCILQLLLGISCPVVWDKDLANSGVAMPLQIQCHAHKSITSSCMLTLPDHSNIASYTLVIYVYYILFYMLKPTILPYEMSCLPFYQNPVTYSNSVAIYCNTFKHSMQYDTDQYFHCYSVVTYNLFIL